MKKNILWMLTGLAAILICGLTVTTLSACSSDDDKNDKADATVEKEVMYAVQISDDVLKVANVEVNYVDQTGAKKKEALSSAQWTKSQKLNNTSPLAQGIWVKITPKTNVASGTYQLKVTTGVACKATLANGNTIMDFSGNDPQKAPVTAQTAEEIADWCSKSPTGGLLVDPSGYCKQQHVDFGGNNDDMPENVAALCGLCELISWLWVFDDVPENICDKPCGR